MNKLPIFLLLLSAHWLHGQAFQSVFPGLSGQTLLDSLTARYKPDSVLNYAQSRDTLYAKVLAIDDDSLRCIYSDHTLYLDSAQDPTQYVYLGGSSLGMNTEHAYPQSKGAAEGNARSDMHHLFPARIPVNEARGSRPFMEIVDSQTERWFYKAQVLFSPPNQNKDWYSEYIFGGFEPREAVKGDLARAVFYFYTMYKSQADAADPSFFQLQRPTLCNWNALDPADSAELVKTWRIAPYQENKPNPFVLDCTLAFRTYCPNTQPDCTVHTTGDLQPPALELRVTPNPFAGTGAVECRLPEAGHLQLRLLDPLGRELQRWEIADAPDGLYRYDLDIQAAPSGICRLEAILHGKTSVARCIVPVITVR
jgi:hypothetical protein